MSLYRVQEFAELAGVTVKALHHYDRLGLLKPRRTEAGYRIYAEHDLTRLEEIVALRFLGLSLKQIRGLLDRDGPRLGDALRLQRSVLEQKRQLLDRAIAAIARAEGILQSGLPAGSDVVREIIEAIQMQTDAHNDTEFMKNYYREEGWKQFKARHRDWPSRAWNELFREIAAALGDDPGSPKAQALAARWRRLRVADSGGDPGIHFGLLNAWADRQYWPEAVRAQFSGVDFDAISRFIAAAFRCYRTRHYGEVVWEKELDAFAEEEKQRLPLAMADLWFKMEASSAEKPSSEKAQELATRWMELVESRTGGHPDSRQATASCESYIRWIDNWPASIHRRLRAIDHERLGAFILAAVSRPMPPE